MVKGNFWERMFPLKRDFHNMIANQAETTARVVQYLSLWLSSRSEEYYQLLLHEADAADRCRFSMEDHLIEAFATPFDRQDIYSISIEMARIIEYAKSTLLAMDDFQVVEDATIHNMVHHLKEGTDQLAEAIRILKVKPRKSKNKIGRIRKAQYAVENEYRAGMVALFNSHDAMYALKYREVYHHIKDAAVNLGYTTDVLHKIIVRVG
jgi:uncharacterized protein Yka (UPF0111/DUF47 family)